MNTLKQPKAMFMRLIRNMAVAAALVMGLFVVAEDAPNDGKPYMPYQFKVGDEIVGQNGITTGFFKANNPLYPGKWKVINFVAGHIDALRLINLSLENKDSSSEVAYSFYSINTTYTRISFNHGGTDCLDPEKASKFIYTNNFGSTPSQFFYRCGVYGDMEMDSSIPALKSFIGPILNAVLDKVKQDKSHSYSYVYLVARDSMEGHNAISIFFIRRPKVENESSESRAKRDAVLKQWVDGLDKVSYDFLKDRKTVIPDIPVIEN